LRDGTFPFSRVELFRSAKECREDGARESAMGVRSFRMPLHSHDKVISRIQFNAFNNPVNGGNRDNPQIVAWGADGLMMAGINLRLAALVLLKQ
jgi:hypothetical protein